MPSLGNSNILSGLSRLFLLSLCFEAGPFWPYGSNSPCMINVILDVAIHDHHCKRCVVIASNCKAHLSLLVLCQGRGSWGILAYAYVCKHICIYMC